MIARALTLSPAPTFSSAAETPRFTETQRFADNRVFSWALVVLGVVAVLGAAGAAFAGEGVEAVVGLALPVLLLVLLGRMGLTTDLRDDRLRVKLGPFPSKTYAVADIETVEARTYRPLREFGGWGLRLGPAGLAWNAYGDRGVQLTLRGGKRVLIGSQRPAELAAAIQARLGR